MEHLDIATLPEHSTPRDVLALERCALLEITPAFRELRREYSRAHGRRRRWRNAESWADDHRDLERKDPTLYMELQEKIGRLSEP